MQNLNKSELLDFYESGDTIPSIATAFGISDEEVLSCLSEFKRDSMKNRSYSDAFKLLVANRDINGVSRNTIANELGINPNTVKKFCVQFGESKKSSKNAAKETFEEKAYERIDGHFDMNYCPSCNSKRVNSVDINTKYCMTCGLEHIFRSDHVLKINYEYLEE